MWLVRAGLFVNQAPKRHAPTGGHLESGCGVAFLLGLVQQSPVEEDDSGCGQHPCPAV